MKKNTLAKKSQIAALDVMAYIYESNITKIHTRGALDRMIEIAKFPYTRNWKHFGLQYLPGSGKTKPISLVSGKRTAYMNKQYDSVRYWLIRQGFLKQEFDGYRYHYTVVKNNPLIIK